MYKTLDASNSSFPFQNKAQKELLGWQEHMELLHEITSLIRLALYCLW